MHTLNVRGLNDHPDRDPVLEEDPDQDPNRYQGLDENPDRDPDQDPDQDRDPDQDEDRYFCFKLRFMFYSFHRTTQLRQFEYTKNGVVFVRL